jgi:hypothetical protein
VPDISPVDELSERPAGREPLTIDQEYGVTPPVAPRVWLYATPIWPSARLAVVTTRSSGM